MSELLVTGASGHLGSAVLYHLVETLKVSPSRIAAASRSPDKLAEWSARGVKVVEADFDASASLAKAFAGVKRLLIISTDAMDEPGKRLRQHEAAIAAAEKAGVSHIVYTSLPNADTSPISFAPDHAGTEKALAKSSIEGWTILRNSWYCENVLMALPRALEHGTWYTAAGEGRISYADRDDYALAAASALAGDFAAKRTLTLGGEQSYSVDDVAALARQASGRPLNVVKVSVDQLVQGMMATGMPEPIARLVASIDTAASAGKLEITGNDMRTLTGRAPSSLSDWFETVGTSILRPKAA